MKLCKDCKWYDGHGLCAKQVDPATGRAYPRKGSIDPVTGEGAEIASWRARAKFQREEGYPDDLEMDTCGTRARWFEAKIGVRRRSPGRPGKTYCKIKRAAQIISGVHRIHHVVSGYGWMLWPVRIAWFGGEMRWCRRRGYHDCSTTGVY